MKLLVEDLKEAKNNGGISEILPADKFVSQANWEAINAAEIAAGEPLGKPRRKFVSREELYQIARN
jgi:ferredoxin--NADP+ reductase